VKPVRGDLEKRRLGDGGFFKYLNPNLTGGWISRLKEKGKRLK
jgi:hypothetical protein